MCVCETNLNVTDYLNICAEGKLARVKMYFSGVVFVQSKMAEQIFTRKGEAIEP